MIQLDKAIYDKISQQLNSHLKSESNHNQTDPLSYTTLPDKNSLYNLFLTSYRMSGYIDSSHFRETLYTELTHGNIQEKEELLNTFCNTWNEWGYALENYQFL